ncbi:hypothetical protein [Methylobacterium sp. J-068]|uniref:hypothetical protein n=1 Tax=Methylobacterium sp. J-068 TaxID=2836649 RepID=UPI001FBBD069|nr:hypothetical protein [Methylobacterium sp. J-068]MCJ2033829.1 hypothetical protein [Methylobacterium sp. J-068]
MGTRTRASVGDVTGCDGDGPFGNWPFGGRPSQPTLPSHTLEPGGAWNADLQTIAVHAGTMTVGDLVLVNAYLVRLYLPLMVRLQLAATGSLRSARACGS